MIKSTWTGIFGKRNIGDIKVMVLALSMSVGFSTLRADEDKIVLKPMHSGASLYFGQMFNIDDSSSDFSNFNSTVTLPQTSLWMIQEATINERLSFTLGFAGTFWYPFPEDKNVGYTSYRTGGVAISNASGSYKFGELENPWMEMSIGQQGYKYNPSAKNFGEYLFRSEAYPTTVRTGDWGAINNAGAGIWGMAFKGTFLNGLLKNDFLITMANERSPLNDISLTDIVSLNLGNVLQIGGGVMMSRLISIDPAKSQPKLKETGWIEWTAADQNKLNAYIQKQQVASPTFLDTSRIFHRSMHTSVVGKDTVVADIGLSIGSKYWANSERPLVQFLANTPEAADVIATETAVTKSDEIEYIDFAATMVMGRFSFNIKPLIGLQDILGPSDLVLYGEASILGLKNYPLYYTETKQRMPIMLGFNLPVFKTLDYFTFEMEYLQNPHMNSDAVPALNRAPRPKSPDGTRPEVPDIADEFYDATNPKLYKVNRTEDDFKWTVTAEKSFGVWSLAVQYGSDHFRPLTGSFHPSYTEAATTKDARYYMLRLMVNL